MNPSTNPEIVCVFSASNENEEVKSSFQEFRCDPDENCQPNNNCGPNECGPRYE